MDILINRGELFKILAYLVISIFLANYVAVKLYWYNSIWYFDMFMHFVGGFWLGLVLIWLLSSKFFSKNLTFELSPKLILKIFFSVLFIGVFWEIYEILVNNIIFQIPFNTLDTLSDIFFDIAGGIFAVFYFFFYYSKKIMGVSQNKVQ